MAKFYFAYIQVSRNFIPMIISITLLSLIFIGIAFLVTENNAKYLLSGYNTMSEQERQKFDIKSYIAYFKKFHIFLGISVFIIGSILYYFINPDWSGIFMGTYPILAYVYFIWKGNQFSKINDRKQNRKTIIAMSFMFSVFIAIAAMFFYTLQDNQIEINDNIVKIKGYYGMDLKTNEIKSIELVNELPEISIKTNGFALQTIKKGNFKTKNGENVKLLINSVEQPIIYITTNTNQKIYYSSKDKSNQKIFDQIKN